MFLGVLLSLPSLPSLPLVSMPSPDPLVVWDQARSSALLRADVSALRSLYVAGSAAGRGDIQLLSDYQGRGARLTGLRTQVFSRVTSAASTTERTEVVVERVLSSVSLRTGCRVLPPSPPTRRVLVMRFVEGQWRMASVTTASTSGSAKS